MSELYLYAVAGFSFLALTILLLLRSRAGKSSAAGGPAAPAEFFPIHCRYFPQVRHALSCDDAPYLEGRASPAVYRRWRKAVRRAGRMYLAGLRDDFSRLNRLARVLARHSPQVRAGQEVELLRLNLRFQFLYGIVLLRFLLGRPAANRLEQMAALIGSLGSRLEQAALAPQMSSGAVTP